MIVEIMLMAAMGIGIWVGILIEKMYQKTKKITEGNKLD